MNEICLSDGEIDSIKSLLKSITSRYKYVEDEEFLKVAQLFAHEIPRRIRACINEFRLLEPTPGVLLISGYPVDDSKIGRTPPHWKHKDEVSPALNEEI